eukprot:CAMPEP_0194069876 /NCGR_PEP_ID=MMETSP0009_2-20130614/87876_1 /TAXON_ID=210454 /ORGANISM="Grammatophora oceanica, Strain CCMP 410" /LENGTH=420 /DNA_ID=CAMNT_0038723101 /DNA_START=256 /DNA_END=1515 /DNA_ORIENTATION=-
MHFDGTNLSQSQNPSTETFQRAREVYLYMPGDIPALTGNERAMIQANYFTPMNAAATTTPTIAVLKAAPQPTATTTPTIVAPKAVPQPTNSPCTASAASIRKELDLVVDADQCPKWATDASYPKEIGIVADKIIKACEHKKPADTSQNPSTETFQRAREVYLQFFRPGTCTFTFPPDFGATQPSPAYHSIAGDSILYLDWKLIDPTVNLHCPACRAHLKHTRTNFSHHKTLFPVWDVKGRPMYAVVMNYKCPQCQSNVAANDGKLLSSLPTYLRCMYPVNPIYATGGFHITEALSQLLENLMVTYANGDFVSKMLYQELGREYTRKVATYLSLSPTRDFAGEREYESGIFPPSGKSLRELYQQAQQSTFTHYGYSHADRNKREIQSVQLGENDLSAIDWTVAFLRNFILPGATAGFDMNK